MKRAKAYPFLALLLLLLAVGVVRGQEAAGQALQNPEVEGEHVDARLVPETAAVVPGQTLWVGLRLDHMQDWHTYWKNPGDAGQATRIDWQLPDGVEAGEILWPVPERIELPADLVDFGYEGEIYLLTRLDVPADFAADRLSVSAEANWLECADICIPGGATVTLDMPVLEAGATPPDSRWADDIAATRANLPREIPLDAMFSLVDGRLNLLVQATEPIFADARDVRFFPGQHRVFDYTAEQVVDWQQSSMQLSQRHHPRLSEAPSRLDGLVLVESADGRQAYAVEAVPEDVDVSALGGLLPTPGGSGGEGSMPLPLVFLFALLGGLILNLMPCVFPVLSLKALSLASHRDAAPVSQRLHGLAYAAGVISAFLVLAAVLLSLQAGGAAVGWGFHLQSPWFVGALVYLFFIMGLSLSGVVDFGTRVMGMGSELTDREGYKGSFFTGVLASVVASPCTAPFMGAALGFALTQSMPVALTVFAALGLGMALPFLLFSFVPALARLLPRPGRWMVIFKQLLAFPLYATVAWLLWVLGRQTGIDAMALVVGSCVLLAFAAWLYQRRNEAAGLWRYANVALIVLCLAVALGVLRSPLLETRGAEARAEQAADSISEPYSDARLAALREEGRPVFVNMTASWCITCLVNERVALTDAVIGKMQEEGVVYLKGDWTNNDPEITAVLRRFETSGVPLYLLYPADPDASPRVLPQILSESLMLDALSGVGAAS